MNTTRVDHYGVPEIIKSIKTYLPKFNADKFEKAFEFARDAHQGQTRKDGSPYITHPLATIKILAELHADEDTLISALLHDVPEDTPKTIDDVRKKFGKNVGFLVDGITKLSKVYYRHNMAERQIESLKKLLMHSAKDPRVILVKLADRLHNMRTLMHVREDKRLRIAKETAEIYVPIANILGLKDLKNKLEDLCFYYLYPEEYAEVENKIKKSKLKLKNVLEKTIDLVRKYFLKEKIDAEIYGRHRNLYTIYKRIKSAGKDLSEVQDILAIRILVKKKSHCYKALGVIHDLFKPMSSKFKDYIAVPKSNGYQSLHTTVFGFNGVLTEFQIRTHKMNTEAKYGILSRYFYKRQVRSMKLGKDKRSQWVEQILDIQKHEQNSAEFLEDLKTDIFEDRIFVFTPQGDSIDLPKGASCIDFAYAIHSSIGDSAISAKINNKPAPLSTVLKTGDVVQIITSSNKKCPDIFWLDFIKTNVAKTAIRYSLGKQCRNKKILVGRDILQKEFNRAGLGLIDSINFKKAQKSIQNSHKKYFADFEDLLAATGEGVVKPIDIVNSLVLKKTSKATATRVGVEVLCESRVGILRDISNVVANFALNIVKVKAYYSLLYRSPSIRIYFDIRRYEELSKLLIYIEKINGVKGIIRVFSGKQAMFTSILFIAFSIWVGHPFLIRYVLDFNIRSHEVWSYILLYSGFFLLFLAIFALKNFSKKTFLQFRENNHYWLITFSMPFLALATIVGEILFFELYYKHWPLLLILMVTVFIYFFTEYQNFRKNRPRE